MMPALATLGTALMLLVGSGAAAQAVVGERRGVVVSIGEPDPSLAEGACAAGDVPFRADALSPRTATPSPVDEAVVREAEQAWIDADFERCVQRLEPIELDALLADGAREVAGRVASLRARCRFGLDERLEARRVIERALAAALPGLDAGTIDFRRFVDEVRASRGDLPGVPLEVRADVEPLRVSIDGRVARCTRSPCTLSVAPGFHVVVVEAVGRDRAISTLDVRGPRSVEVTLPPASAAATREAIERALGEGAAPDEPALTGALAQAYDEAIVVLTWADSGRAHAVLYDRALGRVVARAAASDGQGGACAAVHAALGEWWGVVRPRPIEEEPWLWLSLGAAAVAVGVVIGLVVGFVPVGNRREIVRF